MALLTRRAHVCDRCARLLLWLLVAGIDFLSQLQLARQALTMLSTPCVPLLNWADLQPQTSCT